MSRRHRVRASSEGIRTFDLLHGSRSAAPRMQKRVQIGASGRLDGMFAFRELCADTWGLDNEWTMRDADDGRTTRRPFGPRRAPGFERLSRVPGHSGTTGGRRATPGPHRRRPLDAPTVGRSARGCSSPFLQSAPDDTSRPEQIASVRPLARSSGGSRTRCRSSPAIRCPGQCRFVEVWDRTAHSR
jgi:hypothetical protein